MKRCLLPKKIPVFVATGALALSFVGSGGIALAGPIPEPHANEQASCVGTFSSQWGPVEHRDDIALQVVAQSDIPGMTISSSAQTNC